MNPVTSASSYGRWRRAETTSVTSCHSSGRASAPLPGIKTSVWWPATVRRLRARPFVGPSTGRTARTSI
ncbi:CxxxxCH/CxxCH domain-containing protein [Mycolicibacterium sp. P1-18]|uniref:CxxxxCH/CxxCH domain-containing protein n=1 Tax=Mycolicibacterium sp. P1-18 TaxID=2024615 RepID=UPI0011F2884E|nr:CxxxxCH/CxxCH domain-containing protein [Mycolicibacterium sp. P1-18]